MPPWKPDPVEGLAFAGARRLGQADIETIRRWVDDGALEGNPSDLPPPPRFPDGWQLGQPDLVVTMEEAYTLPPAGPGRRDMLRNFVLPVPLPAARYVRGFEFRPGNPRVVHHANVKINRTRASRTLDSVDREVGFDGRLSFGAAFPEGHFLGWTPGQLPPLPTEAAAWRLEPGSDLVVQLHLRPTERPEPIRVSIGLFFTDLSPTQTPVMLRLGRQDLDMPAGDLEYRIEDRYRLPVDVRLLAVQPHAHYRAREVTGTAILPDGSTRPLLHIGEWDFDWQDLYRYAVPVALPKGTVLTMALRYDNSAGNRRNPDRPPRRVRWGQTSDDEMGDLWFQVLPATEEDRHTLVADFGPKVLGEDAIGYETLIASEPGNARLHEAAAGIQLSLGLIDRGVAHLEAALRIDPGSVEAHYNLATARIWQRRIPEAVEHFSRALAMAPDHVGAHVNLASVLRGQGDAAGAAAHLRRALEIDPANAAAHANLGGILMAERRVREALDAYRTALQANPDLLEPLTELAWTLATSTEADFRRPDEAIAYGERARRLTRNGDVRVLDALAAAYASAGRYADAVALLEQAVGLVPSNAAPDALRLLRERLRLYRQGKSYRDESRTEKR